MYFVCISLHTWHLHISKLLNEYHKNDMTTSSFYIPCFYIFLHIRTKNSFERPNHIIMYVEQKAFPASSVQRFTVL